MTKELVLQRKEFLKDQYEHIKTQYIAVQAGLQECDYWLAELNKLESPEQEQTGGKHD